jgi:DNA-directed RNA polymerase specialized sigma24 family protein
MDAELLKEIASAHGNLANPDARAAFGKFYERHAAWLYHRLCRTRTSGLLGVDAVQDVVQETFYRAFKSAKTFNPNLVLDPSRIEALVRGWLGGIANHVIADMHSHPTPDVIDSMGLERWKPVWADSDDESPESPVVKALHNELQKLSPLQRDILAASELYYQPDTTYQRLPNGVTTKLAEKHRTSADNIRQVRRRTLASLRTKLQTVLDER